MAEPPEDARHRLETYRTYLRFLARAQMDVRFRGKLDPSDLVQQTLAEACRDPERFAGRADGEVAAWLRRALARQIGHAARDLTREKRDARRERSLEQAIEESSARLGTFLAAAGPSPSECAERSESLLRLAEVIESLPEANREVIVLHYWQGWTLAQVAAHLDRSPAAAAGLLQRGLKVLRERLNPRGET